MRIAVMGAGGVGGYFGARLAQAGQEVAFIARGAHLEALRSRGIELASDLGAATVSPVLASEDPADVGPVDVVMFTVKLYDAESAASRLGPLVGPETVVISFLNGIDSEAIIARAVGEARVAGGVARVSAAIEAPGVIAQHGRFASLEFGELDGTPSPRLDAFASACEAAGVRARVSTDIVTAIWRKFVFLASFSAITCLARAPIGPIRASPPTFALYQQLVREALAVAAAKGVGLAADEFDRVMQLTDGLGDGIKASMLVDLERGRPIEVQWLSGAIGRVGRELGVDTPAHDMALAALAPHACGASAG